MVEFWANRINMDLERLEEVPNKLRDKVKVYIQEQTAQSCIFYAQVGQKGVEDDKIY